MLFYEVGVQTAYPLLIVMRLHPHSAK